MGTRIDFEEHIPALQRYAIRLTRNSDAANDLVQETVMRILSRKKDTGQIENPRAFMMTTLKRIFVDGIRRDKKIDKSVEVEDLEVASPDAPQGLVLTAKEVSATLASLPTKLARPLISFVRDEKTYAEISKEEGVPEGTVVSRIARARQALKSKLCRNDADCMDSKDFSAFQEAGL